ncbi:hypothetical protein J19TS2_57410 [Cohnella xylanilytica]|uniref:sensor histidine kinase n=1 Tax=Cohnella xylanilytica TaxID=557555 RepID=UPI001B1BA9D3|nr:hypothetical protein J19TS2_57410 [Cohnella xylanilytica]
MAGDGRLRAADPPGSGARGAGGRRPTPHFLYNTLESLNGLALANGQREMSAVIGALGKFFRA